MSTSENVTAADGDAISQLVVKAMCCVIAADARVTGTEIDVVYDAMAAVGTRPTPSVFRDTVIATCKAIHKKGVITVAESLCESLAALRGGPIANLLLQLQEDVIRSDKVVTESEEAVVAKFREALGATSGDGASLDGETDASRGDEGLASQGVNEVPLAYTPTENMFRRVLAVRRAIDEHVGSRLLIALCVSVVFGALAVFAWGQLKVVPVAAGVSFALTTGLLFLGADSSIQARSEDRARRRAAEAMLDREAGSIAAGLAVPPAVSTDLVAVPDTDTIDDPAAGADGEIKGFETVLDLIGRRSWSVPYRTRVARRLLHRLSGSRQRGGGRSACRCTNCGRRYWFRVGLGDGGVVCPYCGTFQRATLDWKPSPPPTPVIASPRAWAWPVTSSSYSYGPVSVRGYVNKHGTWVAAHSRSRPRRRKY